MSDQKATEKMAYDFPEIISNSEYVGSNNETGEKNQAHNGVTVWHYFANRVGFVNDAGAYAEYNVNIDVKEKSDGHFVYSVGAEKIKGSERSKAPNLTGDPKTILASVNGISPAIANFIVPQPDETVNKAQARNLSQMSDREILADAMMTIAKTPAEQDILDRYRKRIADLNKKQRDLEGYYLMT